MRRFSALILGAAALLAADAMAADAPKSGGLLKFAVGAEPLHPYTQALLDAVPIPDPQIEAKREHRVLGGEVPSPLNPPRGCVFHTRCPRADEKCKMAVPPLREVRPKHFAACIKL